MKAKISTSRKLAASLIVMALAYGAYYAQVGKKGEDKPAPSTSTAKKPAPKKNTPPRNTGRSTAPARNSTSAANDAAANERTFWESIRSSTDAEDFREYLRQYPDGQFAGLARNRLRQLEAKLANTAPATNVPARTATVPRAGSIVRNQMGMEFAYVPAGEFMMGSENGSSNEKPVHRVTIREGFYMGRYEVTQAQWKNVMDSNPSYKAHKSQSEVTGSFVGSVTGPGGMSPISGARVTFINNQTGIQYVTTTDANGEFRRGALFPGTYIIKIEATNYLPFTITQRLFAAKPNQVVPVPLELQPLTGAATGETPASAKAASDFKNCDQCPVGEVSWNDAQEFIRRLNARGDGYTYRLPTEAEWEYAARAGTTSDYAGNLDSMAWYSANSGYKTHPVGQKQPNAWGLYDMHGNVWEWVQDWSGAYSSGEVIDPQGPASGSNRVQRGGGFETPAAYLRSAVRLSSLPDTRAGFIGFRLVGTLR